MSTINKQEMAMVLPKLKAAGLWPIKRTAEYYRKAARTAPDYLIRTLLLITADEMPPRARR